MPDISEEDFFHIEKFRQTSSSIDQCVVKTPITILRNPQNERLSYRVKHNRISSDVDCSLFKDSVHTIGNASEDYIRDITFSLSQFGIPQEYLQEIRFWSL